MEERLHMLTQQSIDAMNENENDDKYKVASVGISKRKVSFWERWTGWYTFLVADLVSDVAFEVANDINVSDKYYFWYLRRSWTFLFSL